MNTLQELFEGTLRDVYYAEKHSAKALPKMAKKATSERLVEALRAHRDQTRSQIERLEKVFDFIGVPARSKKNDAVRGIIKDAAGLVKKSKDHTVRDAAILTAAQSIEHYQISRYGILKAWAQKLGISEAAQLFDETLHEAKDTDLKLGALAESEINVEVEGENHDQSEDVDDVRRSSAPHRKRSKHAIVHEHASE